MDATPHDEQGRAERLRASPPMFRSRFLDVFTRVHPVVPVAIYLPVIAVLVYAARAAPVWQTAGFFLIGYVLWTLVEYWGHRLVFHYEPENGPGARLHWFIHGVHHDHPDDPLRLVMPPAMSVAILGVAYMLMALVLDGARLHATAAGFVAGYLAYDMVHYYVHHSRPRWRIGIALRTRHMRHHFHDPETAFGVSAPWWDSVFGTAARRGGRGSRAGDSPQP